MLSFINTQGGTFKMKEISVFDLMRYLKKGNAGFGLESLSLSEDNGITSKTHSHFDEAVMSTELKSLTFFDAFGNRSSLLNIDKIELMNENEHLIELKVYCINQNFKRDAYYIHIYINQSATCNICNKEFELYDIQSGLNITKYLGYGSIYDGCRLKLNICCDCLDNIIKSCKKSPVEDMED